jgi:hypothetical protein
VPGVTFVGLLAVADEQRAPVSAFPESSGCTSVGPH